MLKCQAQPRGLTRPAIRGEKAEAELEHLAHELAKTHPGAAASLREGMTEILAILRLSVPPCTAPKCRDWF
jgi:hypothetical protein